MCVFSLIYSYVAVCRFCAVRSLIIICFSLLFSNYSTYVFLIFFLCLFSILCVLCFRIVSLIVSPFVYSCLFPTTVQVYRPLPPSGNPTAVNKYHTAYHISCIRNNGCITYDLKLVYGSAIQSPFVNYVYMPKLFLTLLLHSFTNLHKKVAGSKPVNNFAYFWQAECSSPCSQKHSTSLQSKPGDTSP